PVALSLVAARRQAVLDHLGDICEYQTSSAADTMATTPTVPPARRGEGRSPRIRNPTNMSATHCMAALRLRPRPQGPAAALPALPAVPASRRPAASPSAGAGSRPPPSGRGLARRRWGYARTGPRRRGPRGTPAGPYGRPRGPRPRPGPPAWSST